MFKLLNQPYPIEEPSRQRFVKAVCIGAFVGLFLLLFQPFGLSQWQTPYKVWKILGFGLITFLLTTIYYFAGQWLLPRQFSDERWTVGREIVQVIVLIASIAVANRFYLAWLIDDHISGIDLFGMILVTFLIGVFPTVGSILFNYIVQLRKYSRLAAELPVHTPVLPSQATFEPVASQTATVITMVLTFIAENEKDTLTLPADDLLFIESSDNYCTVVYLKTNPSGVSQPVKPLLRSSLSRLEGQINVAHIVRCHRSFIVNLDRVERVTGNAQGYKLHLLGGEFQVPVARKYNETLVTQLKGL